jgi:uncharacterized protein YdhG (YjbR/CyaY superfamily)
VAKTAYKSVDDYIALQPEATQRVLTRVRRVIRKAVPGAEEVISYQIPAYRLNGRMLMFFAGWKEHFSLYPLNTRIAKAFKKDLARYETSKGTIKIPLAEPVPVKLIEGFVKMRAEEVAQANKARSAVLKRKRAAPNKAKRAASKRR